MIYRPPCGRGVDFWFGTRLALFRNGFWNKTPGIDLFELFKKNKVADERKMMIDERLACERIRNTSVFSVVLSHMDVIYNAIL